MTMRVALVVLAVAISSVSGTADFFWRGSNTLFNRDSNWEGGQAPTASSSFSSVDLTADYGFTSFVPAGTYNVGSVLKLPRNGKLTFSGQAGSTTTIKFSSNSTG